MACCSFSIKTALRSGEMLIPGDQWSIFIYMWCEYDPEDAWKGAFRNSILVSVSKIQINFNQCSELRLGILIHVHFVEFMDKVSKATRSGNACLHGMTRVTLASIPYITTQVSLFNWTLLWVWHFLKVCFALCSSSVFSCTDTTTDSEHFYDSIIEVFEGPEEWLEVNDLLTWWNR